LNKLFEFKEKTTPEEKTSRKKYMFEPDSSHLFVHFPVLPVSLVSLVLKKNLTDCQTGSKG